MSKQRPRYPNRNRDTTAPRQELAEAVARAVVLNAGSPAKFSQRGLTVTGSPENRAVIDNFNANPDGF